MKPKKPRLIRVAYFLWVVVPLALFGAYQAWGLPHLIFRYEFADNGDRYNPYKERWYYTCTFVGPYGEFTVDAKNRKCGFVRLFKKPAAASAT
ncbi:MAG: hypothetical protein AAFR71_07755 [Pseudomonadota bacterium]